MFDHGFFCQKTDQTPEDVDIQVENKEFMDEFFVQVCHSLTAQTFFKEVSYYYSQSVCVCVCVGMILSD